MEKGKLASNIYGSDYEIINNEEKLVLAIALTEGSTSNYRMQLLLGKNSLEVGKTLYTLVGKGMLVPVNKGRWTSYSLNSEYMGDKKSRSKKSRSKKSRSKVKKRKKAENNTEADELL